MCQCSQWKVFVRVVHDRSTSLRKSLWFYTKISSNHSFSGFLPSSNHISRNSPVCLVSYSNVIRSQTQYIRFHTIIGFDKKAALLCYIAIGSILANNDLLQTKFANWKTLWNNKHHQTTTSLLASWAHNNFGSSWTK